MLSTLVIVLAALAAVCSAQNVHTRNLMKLPEGEMKPYVGGSGLNFLEGTTHYNSLCTKATTKGYYAIGGPSFCQPNKDSNGDDISTKIGCIPPATGSTQFTVRYLSYKGSSCSGDSIGYQDVTMDESNCTLGDNDDGSPYPQYSRVTCSM